MGKQLRIGEVARLLGVTTKTVRHYHTIGLLAEPGRTAAGYRLYTAHDLLRLHLVRRLQGLGLSLRQIRTVLGTASDAPTLRAALQTLLADVTAQIAALEGRRGALERLLGDILRAELSPAQRRLLALLKEPDSNAANER